MEQHFRRAWFFTHAALKCLRPDGGGEGREEQAGSNVMFIAASFAREWQFSR